MYIVSAFSVFSVGPLQCCAVFESFCT